MLDGAGSEWRLRCGHGLDEALKEMGLLLEERQKARLLDYAQLLWEGNQRMNLTALNEPEEVARKHLADSLFPLCFGWIPQGARVVDVGTGAGLPGIPLAILRPDLEMLFLDSLEKRLAFVEESCHSLGIQGKIHHARAEDAGRDSTYRDQFDLALSRAVAPAEVLVEYCMPLVKPGGHFLAYKGGRGQEEFLQAQSALEALASKVAAVETKDFSWGQRSLVSIAKEGSTPEKYPRKAARIKKAPL